MRIPDQLLHCRYDVYLTLQVADAIYVVCELSSKHTVMYLILILSSDSDFHRTLKIRIVYRESRVLNSDPRSWILDQASTWALPTGAHRIRSFSESTRAAWRAVRACGTQCMVLVQGFRIYLEHLEVH